MLICTIDAPDGFELSKTLGMVYGVSVCPIADRSTGDSPGNSLYDKALSDAISRMSDMAAEIFGSEANAVTGVQTSVSAVPNLSYMQITVTGTAVRLASDDSYDREEDTADGENEVWIEKVKIHKKKDKKKKDKGKKDGKSKKRSEKDKKKS